MVIPLTMLAAMAMVYFIFTLSSVNRGYRTQLIRINQQQIMFNVACTAYSKILARIYDKPWDERFFKSGPVAENNLAFNEIPYDSCVQDVSGKSLQVDICIRVKLDPVSKVYLWRILYNDDLLDIVRRSQALLYTPLPPEAFPGTSGTGYSAIIDQILLDRRTNQGKADVAASKVSTIRNLEGIESILPVIPSGSTRIASTSFGTQWPPGTTPQSGIFPAGWVNPTPGTPPPMTAGGSAAGIMTLRRDGSDLRIAQRDGEVWIEPYLKLNSRPSTATVIVRLYDESGQEILFNNPSGGKMPVFLWVRNAIEFMPCFFKGLPRDESMFLNVWQWDPALGLKYPLSIRKGQKITINMLGSNPPTNVAVKSTAFD